MTARALRKAVVLAVCGLLVSFLAPTPRAQSPSVARSATEEAALDVVKEWLAGWEARDPARVAATMAEDAYQSGAYPNDPPMAGASRGRARFFEENAPPIRSGVNFKMEEVAAMGGPAGTAILMRRVDQFGGLGQFGAPQPGATPGQPRWFTNSVFFYVRDGKILIWYDIPSLFPPVPANQAPPLNSWVTLERTALDVVTNWVEAWNAKNPERVASYMRDDAVYSANYPRDITEVGKPHFLQAYRRAITQGPSTRITQSFAVGGPVGVGVLLRRVERVTVGTQARDVTKASFYWVVNGAIHTWLDLPLDMLPAPAAIPTAR